MYFYIGLLIVVLFFSLRYEETKNKYFVGIIWLIITFISAIRFNVGYDFFYYYGFSTEWGRNFYDRLINGREFYGIINEVQFSLYRLLSNISLYYKFPQFSIIVFSSLISFFVYNAIKSYSSNPAISTFTFFAFPLFYISSLSIVREELAMAMVLFSFKYIKSQKIFPFLLCIAAAATSHLTVLFLIPIFFVYRVSLSKFLHIVFYSLSFIISPVLVYLLYKIAPPQLYSYFSGFEGTGGTKIIYLVNLMYLFTLFTLVKKNEKPSKEQSFLLIMTLIGTILYNSLFKFGQIGSRSAIYFFIFIILLIPDVLASIKRQYKPKTLFYILFSIIFLYTLYVTTSNPGGSKWIPYSSFFGKSISNLKN